MKKIFISLLIIFAGFLISASPVAGSGEETCYVCKAEGRNYHWKKIDVDDLEVEQKRGYHKVDFDIERGEPKCEQAKEAEAETPTPTKPERVRPTVPSSATTATSTPTPSPEAVTVAVVAEGTITASPVPTISPTPPREATVAAFVEVLPKTGGEILPYVVAGGLLMFLGLYWKVRMWWQLRQVKKEGSIYG